MFEPYIRTLAICLSDVGILRIYTCIYLYIYYCHGLGILPGSWTVLCTVVSVLTLLTDLYV